MSDQRSHPHFHQRQNRRTELFYLIQKPGVDITLPRPFADGSKGLLVVAQEHHPIGYKPVVLVDARLPHVIESVEQAVLHAGEKRGLGGYELDQAEGQEADHE